MTPAIGALFIFSSLAGMSLLDTFPPSPAGWAILILAGVPAYLLAQILGEYIMEMANAKVEGRARSGINTTGVRALVMLVVGLLLVPTFYLGLIFALSWFDGP